MRNETTPTAQFSAIGTRPPRYDAADKATGRALFGPDIQLPGMLHGKVLRSTHAHARIRAIDTRRAEALPGSLCRRNRYRPARGRGPHRSAGRGI